MSERFTVLCLIVVLSGAGRSASAAPPATTTVHLSAINRDLPANMKIELKAQVRLVVYDLDKNAPGSEVKTTFDNLGTGALEWTTEIKPDLPRATKSMDIVFPYPVPTGGLSKNGLVALMVPASWKLSVKDANKGWRTVRERSGELGMPIQGVATNELSVCLGFDENGGDLRLSLAPDCTEAAFEGVLKNAKPCPTGTCSGH